MTSVIVSFRFSGSNQTAQNKENILQTFNYWKVARDLFGLELIFINDNSEEFSLQENFIFNMPGAIRDWNQPAARNYAVSLASGDNLLFTDIDHLLYGDFHLLDRSSKGQTYFVFPRFEKMAGEYEPTTSHLNTFFIRKDEFIGYDEEFCGNYGHDDTEFFYRLRKTHQPVLSVNTLTAYTTNLRSADLSRDAYINRRLLDKKTGGKYQSVFS